MPGTWTSSKFRPPNRSLWRWAETDIVIARLDNDGRGPSVYFDVRMPTRWPQAILALAKDFRGGNATSRLRDVVPALRGSQ